MFIESGIRGDLSQCSNRYARANNQCMPLYDPSKPSSYLMYYDVNNLYGVIYRQCVLTIALRRFSMGRRRTKFWLYDHRVKFGNRLYSRSGCGVPAIFMRTLTTLFCPTREKPLGKRDGKLLTTLCDKQRYIIHYHNLQQCTRHSLRMTKIHRILQFA